ncbi:hypothetical protein K6Q96_18235 [Grimontia kaedaensis]|uniref:Tetratricopeptide repeat protein n=1 Tax=Grimontia kaedaensis TaxID=2872157 RepID=A0ABY4X1M8_9GAMM|nr:hypothetical protein [Grimontia kaedaensis]USH05160.1 hypothetical protein K6Q96_18235 [Grimontia kaedaensis]
MSIIEETRELHRKAWSNYDDFTDSLEKAVSICKAAYENGENSPLFINNYAAVLLDLHRDEEALNLLEISDPVFSEYCSNYAIAIAKAAYDLELIRKWNQAATKQPKQDGAIVAFMDWQGL